MIIDISDTSQTFRCICHNCFEETEHYKTKNWIQCCLCLNDVPINHVLMHSNFVGELFPLTWLYIVNEDDGYGRDPEVFFKDEIQRYARSL